MVIGRSQRFHRGFTIVELIIVIVVIAILATVGVVAYNGTQQRAASTVLQSDLRGASEKLDIDQSKNGAYPSTATDLAASPGTTFTYRSSDSASYCLSAKSSRSGVPEYYVTQDGKIQQGACPVVPPPAPTNLAGSVTEVGGYDSYSDYVKMTVTWTSAAPSLVASYEVQGCAVSSVANPSAGTRSCTSNQVTYPAQATGPLYQTFSVRAVAPDGVTKSAWVNVNVQYL